MMKFGDVVKYKGRFAIVSNGWNNDICDISFLSRTEGECKRSAVERNDCKVIDTDGDMTIEVKNNTVTVRRGEEVGIAKCSPEDSFNLFYSIASAISRLEKPWPSVGDGFYSICVVDSKVSAYRKDWLGDTSDKNCKAFGNCYRTREEAEAAAEEIKAVFAKHKKL